MLTLGEGKKRKNLRRLCSNLQINSNWVYGSRTPGNLFTDNVMRSRQIQSWGPREGGKGSLRDTWIRHSSNFHSRLFDSLTIFSSPAYLVSYKDSPGFTCCPTQAYHCHHLLYFFNVPMELQLEERFNVSLHSTKSICFCVRGLGSSPSSVPEQLCGFEIPRHIHTHYLIRESSVT